jgi:Kef-type K+ transport system membrane component KefB
MFLAGLELHLADLAKSGKVSALAGVLGVIFPLALGTGVGLAFSMETASAIFVGLILSATSVSISAQTLMELKVLRSRVGISLLGAAIFDDILVILCLSIFSAFAISGAQSGLGDILGIVLRMALFLGAGATVGILVLPRASSRVSRLPISQGLIAFVVVTILLYGWTAEMLGNMAAITGAFLAGLMFARSPVREHIESGITALAFGLFVPIFFIDVGLKANLRELSGESLWIFLAMTLVAVLGKVLGSGLGGWLSGLKGRESL